MTSLSSRTSDDDFSELWDSDLDGASFEEATTPSVNDERSVSLIPETTFSGDEAGDTADESGPEGLLIDAIELLQLALSRTRRNLVTEKDSAPELKTTSEEPDLLSSYLPGKNRVKMRAVVGGFILRASGPPEGQ
jgi:hypothetical protein